MTEGCRVLVFPEAGSLNVLLLPSRLLLRSNAWTSILPRWCGVVSVLRGSWRVWERPLRRSLWWLATCCDIVHNFRRISLSIPLRLATNRTGESVEGYWLCRGV